jgi:hypothetical protein
VEYAGASIEPRAYGRTIGETNAKFVTFVVMAATLIYRWILYIKRSYVPATLLQLDTALERASAPSSFRATDCAVQAGRKARDSIGRRLSD